MSLEERSKFLEEVLERHKIPKDYAILEIGYGDKRNLNHLVNVGYGQVDGIDKADGCSIEEFEPKDLYDVVFTMSTLFLIPEPPYEKIAKMARKYLITIEGETSKGNGVIGRDYGEIFTKLGFDQIEHQTNVFNEYGVLRVFKKHD